MNNVGYLETEHPDWQILQGNLTLLLDTRVCMNSKSRLIKSTDKSEILLNEVKRTVIKKKKDKLRKKMKVLRCKSSFQKLYL